MLHEQTQSIVLLRGDRWCDGLVCLEIRLHLCQLGVGCRLSARQNRRSSAVRVLEQQNQIRRGRNGKIEQRKPVHDVATCITTRMPANSVWSVTSTPSTSVLVLASLMFTVPLATRLLMAVAIGCSRFSSVAWLEAESV